jgi:hypothetical protein
MVKGHQIGRRVLFRRRANAPRLMAQGIVARVTRLLRWFYRNAKSLSILYDGRDKSGDGGQPKD